MKYNHIQMGKWSIASFTVVIAFNLFIALDPEFFAEINYSSNLAGFDYIVPVFILIYLLVINFFFMRIRIDSKKLSWHFGIGFPRKSLLVEDLASASVVRNKWWYGWGIRKLLSGGWLYNVHGLDAVEVVTKKGKIVRLGTDEPKKIVKVIRALINKETREAR